MMIYIMLFAMLIL